MSKSKKSQEIYFDAGFTKDEVELLHAYFNAFSNLYGKVSLRNAFEIINEQNDNRFSKIKFLAFLKLNEKEKNFYHIVSRCEFYDDAPDEDPFDDDIVNEAIVCIDEDDYYSIDEQQMGKPLCVLPKESLLKYADDSYREDTPATEALERYIEEYAEIIQPTRGHHCVNTARDVVDDFVFTLHIDLDNESMHIDDLLRLVVLPEDDEEFEKFMHGLLPLAVEVANTTRRWSNRGYTPRELAGLLGDNRPRSINIIDEELPR